MNDVAVVAIGRNEGERLGRCLASLQPEGVPVVYVDSGSTDGSVARARAAGVDVVELDPARPFSAARARNEGFDRATDGRPGIAYVMFVDGDCEVADGWLARARAELEARPDLAAVCGRRRELHPERSAYNRLADLEWDTPVGLADSCGGDAMFRAADFRAVGGFDPTAKAGEEPELCQRLRRAGRKIARVDAEMTRHDLNMTRFSEWWRRQTRVGYHGLDVERRFPPADTARASLFGPGLRRARIWGIGWPLAVAAAAAIGWWAGGSAIAALAVACGIGVLGLQAARLAWKVRRRVARPADAALHGVLMVVEKWANLAGQCRYVLDRGLGRGSRLIEYKQPDAPRAAHRTG